MPGHAVEEDRLERRVGEQVGGLRHLPEGGPGAPHRHDDPPDPRLADDSGLVDIFRIIGIDRGQRHDRPDLLAIDDRPERPRPLPGASNHLPRHDHGDPLLEQVVPRHAEHHRRRDRNGEGGDPPGTGVKPEQNPPHARPSLPEVVGPTSQSAADCSRSPSPGNPNPRRRTSRGSP
jgi:hypothetical protein